MPLQSDVSLDLVLLFSYAHVHLFYKIKTNH